MDHISVLGDELGLERAEVPKIAEEPEETGPSNFLLERLQQSRTPERADQLVELHISNRRGRPPGRLNGEPANRPFLKKLTQKHRRILAMHLEGYSGKDIAKTLGVTSQNVYHTLNDPLALEVLHNYFEGQKSEIKGLLPDVIEAVKEGLGHESTKIRLMAVDRFCRLFAAVSDKVQSTAQDQSAGGVHQDVRLKFVTIIRDAAERSGITLEGTATQVEGND